MEELIDYTLLDKTVSPKRIEEFVQQAVKSKFKAICVYPSSLPLINSIKSKIDKGSFFPKICTVINFPSGKATKTEIIKELIACNDLGKVDEIDVVWNYNAWGTCGIGYDPAESIEAIDTVVDWVSCTDKPSPVIKVILETGYLCYPDTLPSVDVVGKGTLPSVDGPQPTLSGDGDYQNLRNAIYWILSNFYDSIHFLKTSTGKSEYGGASIDAVKTMISCIREFNLENSIGIKVSGGIKTKDQIYDYLYLFEESNWKGKIRFGTSTII